MVLHGAARHATTLLTVEPARDAVHDDGAGAADLQACMFRV
jgi:hypothetical protein